MTRRIAINTAAVGATLVGMALVVMLREAVLIFILSLIVSAAIRPAVDFFSARGVSATLAVIAAYGLFLVSLGIVVLLLSSRLVSDIGAAGTDLLNTYEYIAGQWPQGTWIERQIAGAVPPKDRFFADVAGNHGIQTLQTAGGITFSAAGILVSLVFVIILSVYWSLDRVRFERLWLSLLAGPRRAVARDIWHAVETEMGSYLRSEYLQGLMAVLLLSAGFWALGQPYPVLLALICAAAWTLPWAGFVIAGMAVFVMALPALVLQGNVPAIASSVAAMVYTCGVLLVLEFYVEPRLFARQRFNMVVVAAVSISLAYAFGLVGLLLGPPLAVIIQVVGGHLLRQSVDTRIAEDPAAQSAELSARLAALRESLSRLPAPSPEQLSLLQRLDDLLAKARGFLPAAR